MKLVPLIKVGSQVYFYGHEFVCRCGKCRYSDPELMPHIMPLELKEHLTEYRMALNKPIIITRFVSCLEHHQNIYKRIYGTRWEQYITKDSSHVPDKEKKIHGGQSEVVYGLDHIPQVDFLRAYALCNRFRFKGIIWYKKLYVKENNREENSFIHIDDFPIRSTAYIPSIKYYKKY